MDPTGREPAHRAEAEPVEFPPPPLGGSVLTRWAMSRFHTFWMRAELVCTYIVLLAFGIVLPGVVAHWALEASRLGAPPGDFAFGLAWAAVWVLLAWGTLGYRLAKYCEVRGVAIAGDHIVLQPLWGHTMRLTPLGIALARVGPRVGLRLYRHPWQLWRVLRLQPGAALGVELAECLGRLGIPIEHTRW